jgi:hypothetical protein
MNTKPLGALPRDVMARNMDNFRLFGPDENTSNKLDAVYEVSKKLWLADYKPDDDEGGRLSPDGRVLEMLSVWGEGDQPMPLPTSRHRCGSLSPGERAGERGIKGKQCLRFPLPNPPPEGEG